MIGHNFDFNTIGADSLILLGEVISSFVRPYSHSRFLATTRYYYDASRSQTRDL